MSEVDDGKLIHGPWGNNQRRVEREIVIPAGTNNCQVSWTSFNFGSRDGHEWDQVAIDGDEVWAKRGNHCNANDGWTTLVPSFNWGSPHDRRGCYVDVRVVVPCEGTMEVRFTSSIDEGINNEAWAFGNLLVVPADGIEPESDDQFNERVNEIRRSNRGLVNGQHA